ncbi:MAG: hypothetical protein KU37_06645 [Sulfuricurvum sp. PC08-66]|nr:MAG: hypothetical protein KU37_06645 [Sulfuricurvum sp. PC08-66]
MRAVWALGRFFAQGFYKTKATTLMLLLTVAVLALAWAISDIDIGSQYKLFEDLLLTSQIALLHLMALFYAYEYGQKERMGGVFVLPLAVGVSRSTYLYGVIAGQVMMLGLFTLMLLAIDTTVLYFFEGHIALVVLGQVVLGLLSAILLALLVVMFMQFVSVMNSVIYALLFYMVGNGMDELYAYAFWIEPSTTLQNLYSVLGFIIPDFSLFDRLGPVVNRSYVDSVTLFMEPLLYFGITSLIVIVIAQLKFARRALKVGA